MQLQWHFATGPVATTPGLHPENDDSSHSGIISIIDLRMPISDWIESQIESKISNQQSQITWLGRQLADHVVSDTAIRPIQPTTADRCPVRIPPELLDHTSSRSSPECSPPCQGGDQGFKSPRGRFLTSRRGTQSGKAASTNDTFLSEGIVGARNLRGLWVRLPLASLTSIASAGHWRAQVAVTHPPSGFGGSTPSRRIHFQFLSSRVGQSPSGPHKP